MSNEPQSYQNPPVNPKVESAKSNDPIDNIQPDKDKSKDNLEQKTDELVGAADELTTSIDKLSNIEQKIERQNRIFPTILRATAYALGSTLGLAIIISIIFYILKSLGLLDSLNSIFSSLKDLKNLYK